MPVFAYEAMDSSGLEVKDTIEAPSEAEAQTMIREKGFYVTKILRAINSDNLSSEVPAVVTFRILPPIWARWWFIAFCILLLGGVVIGFFTYRTARLREVDLALEEARLAEEK